MSQASELQFIPDDPEKSDNESEKSPPVLNFEESMSVSRVDSQVGLRLTEEDKPFFRQK